MVYSNFENSYLLLVEDFLRLKHCGILKTNGLREYLASIGVKHYPSVYFQVNTQFEDVPTDDKNYNPEYPHRLKSMHIELASESGYYGEAYSELDNPEFRNGLMEYFERKGYPISEFMKKNGSDDKRKIDQFFLALIRDGIKFYRDRMYVWPHE